MLDKYQKNQLRELITSPGFTTLEAFANQLKEKIGTAKVFSETEWDFTKSALQKEHKIAMIDEFFRLLEEEAAGMGDNEQ